MSDKLDQLIERFKTIKEELNKNINGSYMSPQNQVSAAAPNMAEKAEVKGVNVGNNPKEPGRSEMGVLTRLGANEEAKEKAKQVSREIKRLKPKLVKGEMCKIAKNGQWSL